MAKTLPSKEDGHSLLKTLWEIGTVLISGVKPLIHQLREGLEGQLDHYVGLLEKRMVVLALQGFALFSSLILIGLGLLFMVIDYGGVPRGLACLGGGLMGFVALILLILFTKQNGRTA